MNIDVTETTKNIKIDAQDLQQGGSFDTGTWNDNGDVTFPTDGSVEIDTAQTSDNVIYDDMLTPGARYRVTVECTDYTSGKIDVAIGGAVRTIDSTGLYSLESESNSVYIIFRTRPGQGFVGTLDNLTVVETTDMYKVGSLQKGLILDMPMRTPYTEASILLNDPASSNLTGNIDIEVDCSVDFDTDHYEVIYASDTQHVFWDVGMELDKTYFVSVDVKDGTSASVEGDLIAWGGINSFNDRDIFASFITTGSWQTISGTVTITNADNTKFDINSGMTVEGDYEIRNIIVKEIDGTTLDRTPYNSKGTVSGAVVSSDYTTFDGTGYVDAEGALDRLESGNALSMAFWVKQDIDQARSIYVYSCDGSDTTSFTLYNDNGVGYKNGFTGQKASILATTVDSSEWHHYVATDSGSEAKLYIDGAEITPDGAGLLDAVLDDAQTIGARISGGSPINNLNGNMADFKIWNRVLTSEEAKLLYDKGRGN